MGKLSQRTFWGCLRVAYVMTILGLLLLPALFIDMAVTNNLVAEPFVIKQSLDFDFTQPKPVALLPLFSKKEIERIQTIPPHKNLNTRVFPVGSKFHVTVLLTLPESDYNLRLGMFQLTAETLSARDKVILRSSKLCRLKYRSYPLRIANTLLFAVPHFFRFGKEAQKLEVDLLEAQEKAVPTAGVRILLESKASDGGGVPEIYDASIRLESTLPRTRALISSFKWVFFLWNGLCIFLFEVGVVLCCCRGLLIPTFGKVSMAEGEVLNEHEALKGEIRDGRAVRDAIRGGVKPSKKARSTRHVCFEDDVPGAAGYKERRMPRTQKHHEKAEDTLGTVDDKYSSA
jgi:seipin